VLEAPGDFVAMDLVAEGLSDRTTTTVLEPGRVYAVPRADFCELMEQEPDFFKDFSTSWHAFYKGCAGFLV
jgi:CRP-like cAMP-binding protein